MLQLVAASAFLTGGLGHSGVRKRWSSETRKQKADAAKQYAKDYALTLIEKSLDNPLIRGHTDEKLAPSSNGLGHQPLTL